MRRLVRSEGGFTLVELVVVLAVIALGIGPETLNRLARAAAAVGM